jgi:hypothetical protein
MDNRWWWKTWWLRSDFSVIKRPLWWCWQSKTSLEFWGQISPGMRKHWWCFSRMPTAKHHTTGIISSASVFYCLRGARICLCKICFIWFSTQEHSVRVQASIPVASSTCLACCWIWSPDVFCLSSNNSTNSIIITHALSGLLNARNEIHFSCYLIQVVFIRVILKTQSYQPRYFYLFFQQELKLQNQNTGRSTESKGSPASKMLILLLKW